MKAVLHRLPCALLLATITQWGCYTTRVVSDRAGQEPEYARRQWFTLAGFVELSEPGGRECKDGIADASSQLNGIDILTDLAMAAAGGIAGNYACAKTSPEVRASCAAGGALVAPLLLSARTVHYRCASPAQSAKGPNWLPSASAAK